MPLFPPIPIDRAFPRDDQGRLINPDYIAEEGRNLLQRAEATTGAASAPVRIDIAPQSQAPYNVNQWQPTFWEQGDWNKTPDQLRQELNLDLLRTSAERRRLELENSYEKLPLENRLLEARTAAQGAMGRYRDSQDAETLDHTAGFFEAMSHPNAPQPGSPEYSQYVMNALYQNPRFATTAGGRAVLAHLGQGQNVLANLADIQRQIGPGYNIGSIRIGPRGPSVSVKPAGEVSKDLLDELKGYGVTPSMVANPIRMKVGRYDPKGAFIEDPQGDIVLVAKPDKSMVPMSSQFFESAGGKYPDAIARQRKGAGAAPTPGGTPAKSKYSALYEGG